MLSRVGRLLLQSGGRAREVLGLFSQATMPGVLGAGQELPQSVLQGARVAGGR